MNKNLHRIIFNAKRGQLMVVCETASGQGKSASGERAGGGFGKKVMFSPLHLALAAALGLSVFAQNPGYAQIVADPSAPRSQQATVLGAAGAAPLVNIQTPSAAGVSRNTYIQFDVNRPGAVLNNSRTNTQSQLAGAIPGNPWLATGSARVILNEVNSSNPSQLRGYVEVAGQRAEVIIANPAGINIDGAGFINASRVTLTTGTPVINGGNLESYRVQGGNISINGQGLDARDTDYTGILARAVQVNAGIWAKDLKVVTGSNVVDASHTAITPIAGTSAAPAFALDVAQLGGMYAGKIFLVGTEAGVGTRNAGTVVATGGKLVLQANGWLTNTGTLQAQGAMQLQTTGKAPSSANITNSGAIISSDELQINSAQALDNSGGSISAPRLEVTATSLVNRGGVIEQTGSQDFNVQGASLSNANGGKIGEAAASAATTSASNAAVAARSYSAGNLAISGALNNDAGRINATGGIALTSQSGLNNDGGTLNLKQLQVTGDSLSTVSNNSGTLRTQGDLRLQTGQLDNQSGSITAGGQLQVTASGVNNTSGSMTQNSASATSLAVTGSFNNAAGTVNTDGDLTLTSASLANTQGRITSGQNATLTTQGAGNSFDNTDGQVVSNQNLNINTNGASNLLNTSGTLQASGGSLSFNGGDLSNSTGRVFAASDMTLQAANISNASGGSVYAAGNQRITATGAVSNAGVMGAQGDVTINANSLSSATNSVLAAGIKADRSPATSGNLTVNTTQALAINGQVSAVNDITLAGSSVSLAGSQASAANISATARSGDLSTANAVVSTPGTLTLNANNTNGQTLNNTSGTLSAQQLRINAANLNNSSGQITQTGTADTTLDVASASSTRGTLNNTQGRITTAAQNFTVSAQTLTNTSGAIDHAGPSAAAAIAAGATVGTLTVNATTLDNTSASIGSNGALQVNASNINNTSGNIKAAVDTRLDASSQINNTSGNITAGNDLALSTGNLLDAGTLTAGRDVSLSLQGDFSNSAAGIQAARNLSINSTGSVSNSGTLQAVGDVTITATNAISNDGASSRLLAGGQLNTQSSTLANSGSVIGAQVSLAATQSITNAGPSALIGATDANGKLELLAPNIYNRDDSTATDTAPQTRILGLGDVVLAGSKDAAGNYSRANQVLNQSASIESGRDMNVVADTLTNTRRVLTVGGNYNNITSWRGSEYWYPGSNVPGGRYIEPPRGGARNSDYVRTDYTVVIAQNGVEQISPESRIVVGRNMATDLSTLQNYWSKVTAGGNIALGSATLDQNSWRGAPSLSQRETYANGTYLYRTYKGEFWTLPWGPEVRYTSIAGYASTFTAGGGISGSGNTIINGATGAGSLPSVYAAGNSGTNANLLTLPSSSLYSTNAAGGTLIQTNSAFAATRPWQGSDFYLRQLGLDPSTAPRRLGDNFYEQELVKQQVLALSGKAVFDNYTSAQAQYEQMFARGAANARALGLTGSQAGVSLSPAQIANLTGDVIMLEEREVDIPNTGNGSTTKQKVLVPIVYLARIKPGDLQASGALIAAANINLTNTQGFANAGTLQSTGDMSIAMASNAVLNNRGGNLKAGQLLSLRTVNSDIDLTSASVKAGSLNIDSGGKLILATASQSRTSTNQSANSSNTRTQTDLGQTGSIDVTGNASIKTQGNFEQTGATLSVGGNLAADIGGSYILGALQKTDTSDAAFQVRGASGSNSSTFVQNITSSIQVGGNSQIKTGQDFTSQGANIALNTNGSTNGQGTSQITAGGNINLLAVKDSYTNTSQSSGGSSGFFTSSNFSATRQSFDESVRGTNLSSTGNNSALTLSTNKDINIAASQVQAQGALKLNAGNVNITTVQEQHNSASTDTGSGGNFFRRNSSTERQTSNTSLAIGSQVGGGTVNVNAAQDINIKGSSVIADKDATLTAGNNINITAGQNTTEQTSFVQKSQSGFLSGGGLGITYGNRVQSLDNKGQQTTAAASTVGAITGDININAGQAYKQVGSDLVAPAGDINITAKKVDIVEARETSSSTTEQKFKQSGITLQVTAPVISALQGIQQLGQSAGQTSSGRMQGLAAASMALTAKNAANALQAGQGSNINGKDGQISTGPDANGNPTSRDANAADKVGGINIAISLGSSSSQSNSSSKSDTARGSSITAGRNVNINATGADTSAGQQSDLLIQGSSIKAGNNVSLSADNSITLQAAKNESSQTGTNSSSSGSIGIGFALGGSQRGFTINAGASKGKGSSDGADTTFSNTSIQAGNTASIKSGADTNIKGAVVAANQIKADIGGNLFIESLQDTSTYTSSQSAASVGVSLCIPPFCYGTSSASASASKSNLNSNFQSVNEQSGLKAGDGGFQVSVGSNTALTGAVISSTDKAVNDGKNTFSTGGNLSITDIQNQASFKGSGYSVGVNVGGGSPSSSFNPGGSFGVGSKSGDAASTSSAGISGIAGNTAVRTGDAETGIKPIFDAEKVQRDINAQIAITAAFGSQASKAIGDYAQTQTTEAKKLRNEANTTTDSVRAKTLNAQAQALEDNWGDNGTLRLIAHTVVGGLTGGLGGAAGAAAGTLAAPQVASALTDAGITGGLAATITALTSTAAGAIAGGATGGGLAGAGAAFNEVTNNYLNHSEALKLSALKDKKTVGKCDAACANEIRDLEALDLMRNQELQNCTGVTSTACGTARQDVRNAAADYVRKNSFNTDLNQTYKNEKNETITLALDTMTGVSSAQVLGALLAVKEGIVALGSAARAGFDALILQDPKAQAQAKTGAGAAWEFVKDPVNWPELLGAMSSANREKLARAYEAGDGLEVGMLMGAQIANLPVGGGGLGTIKKIDRVLDIAAAAALKELRADGLDVIKATVGTKGSWERAINGVLEPKTAYVLDNGHAYVTDASGRVNSVVANLDALKMDRNTYQQAITGAAGAAGDQGGHLIAATLGGAGDRINLVPQAATLNNGAWKAMENEYKAALEAGRNVSIKVEVAYPPGGGVRPDAFRVTATLDGKTQPPRIFNQ